LIPDPSSAAPASRQAWARRALWPGFAIAGGILWGLCFGRVSVGVAAWLGLVPLVLLLGRPHAGWLCFLNGLAAWDTGLYWVVPTLQKYGSLSWPLAALLTTVLAAYLAIFHGLFGRLGAPMWRRWLSATAPPLAAPSPRPSPLAGCRPCGWRSNGCALT
jgi:apolipoprotein N-acyltransferase